MIRYQTDDEGVVSQPEYTLTKPSNGPNDRDHLNLQHRLCNRHGLRVTVAHYPPATSKWNPIEHRLFCVVSKNWAGRPLDSYETILKYLRTTRTATGLRVRAHLVRKTYKTGVKVTDAQMRGATHHTEQLPPQMELHHRTHVTKNGSYFCSGPKGHAS